MANFNSTDSIKLRQPVQIDGGGLTINPNVSTLSPSVFASVGTNPTGIFVLDNFVYVVNSADSTLTILETSVGGAYSTTGIGEAVGPQSIFVIGDIAIITCSTASSVIFMDVSLHVDPQVVSTLPTSGPTSDVYVSGHIAYVTLAAGGLITIDITEPYNPVILDSVSYGDAGAGVVVYPIAGSLYAFTADTVDNGIYLINVGDPTNISAGGSPITVGNGPKGIDVTDELLFVANSVSNTVSVVSLDETEVINSAVVGTAPQDVQVCGNYLFVSNVTDHTVSVFDITVPSSPISLGVITFSGPIGGMFVVGRTLYVTLNASGQVAVVELPGISAVSIQTNTADIGSLLVRNQATFTDDVQVNRGLYVGFPGIEVNGPISINGNTNVGGNLSVQGAITYTNQNVSGSLSVGTSRTDVPFVISGETGGQQGYGNIQELIVTASSETGLQLNNTSSGGHDYCILSTGASSGAGVGNFVIGDATEGASRLVIDSSGNVGIGTQPAAFFDLNGFVKVFNTPLSQPAAPTLSVVGTAGSTTYTYEIQQIVGSRYSTPSSTVSITGPDSLDGGNFIQVTMPDSNTYIVYRSSTSNPGVIPVGSLGTSSSILYDNNADTPSGGAANGPLPFANDRSTGVFITTSNTRSIYNPTSGAGVILGAFTEYFDAELRIVGNLNAWQDSQPVTYVQLQNQMNNMAVFMGGTSGNDVVLDRLQFCSTGSTFTTGTFSGTPVPTSVLELYNTSGTTNGLTIFAANSQSVPLFQIQTPPAPMAPGHFGIGGWTTIFEIDGVGNTSLINTLQVGALGPASDSVIDVVNTSNFDFVQCWLSAGSSQVLASVNSAGLFQSVATQSAVDTVTYSSTPTFDCTLGNIHAITLTNDASPSFTNVITGQVVMVVVTQDSAGGHLITWGGNVIGNPPPLIQTPNAVTTFEFVGIAGGYLTPVNNASVQIAAGENIMLTPSGNIMTISASEPTVPTLVAGSNITLTPSGDDITIAASFSSVPTVQTVGPGPSANVDLSQGSIVHVLMNGDVSIDVTNMVQGQSYTFLITQDNGNVVTWSGNFIGGMTIGFGTNDTAHTTSVQQFICPDGARLVAVTNGIGDLAWP